MTEEELLRCLRVLRSIFSEYSRLLDEREAFLRRMAGGAE